MIVYSPSSEFAIKADQDFPQYVVSPDVIVTDPGSSIPAILKDANVINNNGSDVLTNARITTDLQYSPAYEVTNPSVAAINSDGYVSRVSNGTALINARSGPNLQRLQVPVSFVTGTDSTSFVSWRASSLAKFSNDRINTLLTNIVPSNETQVAFSGNDRNPALFCASYAASLTAVAYTAGGSSGLGYTAITSRHVVAVAHPGNVTGTQLVFVTTGNVRVNRTIIKSLFVPGVDVAVYLLDSALPSTISPMRIAPTNILNYLPTSGQFPVPCIFIDQSQKISVAACCKITASNIQLTNLTDYRAAFYTNPTFGDSGKPWMMFYGSAAASLMLMGLFTTPGSGPSFHALPWNSIIPALDASAGISTGLQPTRASLTAFTNFP